MKSHIPQGSHAGRTIAALMHAHDDPALSAELSKLPDLVAAMTSFLDDAFSEPEPINILPLPLIQLVVDHIGHGPLEDPNQLRLDLGLAS